MPDSTLGKKMLEEAEEERAAYESQQAKAKAKEEEK